MLLGLLAFIGAMHGIVPTPSPTPFAPIYAGHAATRFTLTSRIIGVTPDGTAQFLVRTRFFDARGLETRILANSDLDWSATGAQVQWQSRQRFGMPSAIVSTTQRDRAILTVVANLPPIGTQRIVLDASAVPPQVVAHALGPHLVQIGIFPRTVTPAIIRRTNTIGTRVRIARLPIGTYTYRDRDVRPNATYSYDVTIGTRTFHTVATTGAELPATAIAMVSGKGMWLAWSLSPLDPDYFGKIDADAIVAQAVHAGLHYVELRTTYGELWQIPPNARPFFNRLVDGLTSHGIVPVAWTVPRAATFGDLSLAIRSARYRTSHGSRLLGLAVDLERGGSFLRDPASLRDYLADLRAATGPSYLLVATLEDPVIEHLDERTYPYREIGAVASVLQPMTYWRMPRAIPDGARGVASLMHEAVTTVQRLAGRALPVSIGGQTTAGPVNGYPPADELLASLTGARAAGAIGVCYFDWAGTQPFAWDTLAGYRW